jgi:antitoxin component of MazEF toxin-antitoxin module
MIVLEVTVIDGKPAVVLPPELVNQLGLVEGSRVAVDETAFHPLSVLDEQMQIARRVMREDHDALRDLAK